MSAGQDVAPTDTAAAVLARLEAAHAEVCRIAAERWQGGSGWRTSIPARPDHDSDLLIGVALRAASTFIRSMGSGPIDEPKAEPIDDRAEAAAAITGMWDALATLLRAGVQFPTLVVTPREGRALLAAVRALSVPPAYPRVTVDFDGTLVAFVAHVSAEAGAMILAVPEGIAVGGFGADDVDLLRTLANEAEADHDDPTSKHYDEGEVYRRFNRLREFADMLAGLLPTGAPK